MEVKRQVCATTFVSDDGKNGIIKWEDGRMSKYHSLWLISYCQCSECIETDSNCRRVIQEAPLDLTLKQFSTHESGGEVRVLWNQSKHRGQFTTDYLREHCYSEHSRQRQRLQVKPSIASDLTIPKMAWPEVKESDELLYRFMRHINEEGIGLLTDVPTESGYLKNVVQKFGNLVSTMYGEFYELVALPKAINNAFTSEKLPYHADLQYYGSSPGLQFFHCIRFDDTVNGGESGFIDMFQVLEEYKNEYPKEFRILCEVPMTFQRIHYDRKDPVRMLHRKPIIRVNECGDIIGFSYNPTAMGPPLVTEENVEVYQRGLQLLINKIEEFPHVRRFRYRPGYLICLNNKRFLHGRTSFNHTTGVRHLQGGYGNIDDFKSRLAILSEKYGEGKPLKRVGNDDWA